MADLRELLARVQAATGLDRQIDRDVMISIGGWHRVEPRFTSSKHGAFISPDDWIGELSGGAPILDGLHGTTMHRDVPPVTASLDATTTLIEKVIPGAGWEVRKFSGRTDAADAFVRGPSEYASHGPTSALALLSAFLRLMIAREDGDAA